MRHRLIGKHNLLYLKVRIQNADLNASKKEQPLPLPGATCGMIYVNADLLPTTLLHAKTVNVPSRLSRRRWL